ncbi:MAG: hypothetical protein FWG94_10820 [Oscillospiraceae bacterium]|nr:hypothetical protein [Oscillospiraceae bacterium]
MVSVIIAADSQEKKFFTALRNILSRNFKSIQCVEGCVDAKSEDAGLFITDAVGLDFIYSSAAIFVFKDCTPIPAGFETTGGQVAIVDSGNNDAMKLVSSTKMPAVTCGLSPCDTLTLSSLSEDSAVIGLQRCITCFDGAVIEPQEIPVSLCAQVDSFTLLSAAAIFILTGNIKKLSQAEI